MVTTEKIDDELVDTIRRAACPGYGAERRIIALTLAWLANNPIEPTPDQMESIWYKRPDITRTGSAIVEFQRIAYLEKDPEYPEELKAMLFDKSAANSGLANDLLKKAYKLGKKDGAK